jgi:putative protease
MASIELLSPARDLECGKAAVGHGADAVYIGGPSFGARSAAGNSLRDIALLADYAHLYNARVYLTLNTILFDRELEEAGKLARRAAEAGVDALIIQDLGLLELDLPPLPLIASTQMHNAGPEHVAFLEKAGFQRVILARELSLEQIRRIREKTSVELEAFVHGALCVSYSGRCYLSAALGGRGANRGECGQPCRLPWTLLDADGNVLEKNRHLLSLKDMDRSQHLSALIDSGVTAFKIEGRLKDVSYVKNITAYYRKKIDAVLESRPGLARASSGRTRFFFEPDPSRTFFRGATPYFLDGDSRDIWSPDTPKSVGEKMGTAGTCGADWFTFREEAAEVHAGDGLCFFDRNRVLQGLQVVKAEKNRVRVRSGLNGLNPGMPVYRNRNHRFLRQLEGRTSERRIGLSLVFRETSEGFELSGCDEDGVCAAVRLVLSKDPAANPDAAVQTMRKQLSRLNDTLFCLESLRLDTAPYFIHTAHLNRLRRDLAAALEQARKQAYARPGRILMNVPPGPYPVKKLDYRYNVSNRAAQDFYRRHGVEAIEPAFELQEPPSGTAVMTSRHCLKRCLSACPRQGSGSVMRDPLFIENAGRRFRLAFDCRNCRMLVLLT